jgi:hypothetical protein
MGKIKEMKEIKKEKMNNKENKRLMKEVWLGKIKGDERNRK